MGKDCVRLVNISNITWNGCHQLMRCKSRKAILWCSLPRQKGPSLVKIRNNFPVQDVLDPGMGIPCITPVADAVEPDKDLVDWLAKKKRHVK